MDKFEYVKCLRGREDLTPALFRTLVMVWSYADAQLSNARPGAARLARDTGIGIREAKRQLRHLERAGYLIVTARGGSGPESGRTATTHALAIPEDAQHPPTSGAQHPRSDPPTSGAQHPRSDPPTSGAQHPRSDQWCSTPPVVLSTPGPVVLSTPGTSGAQHPPIRSLSDQASACAGGSKTDPSGELAECNAEAHDDTPTQHPGRAAHGSRRGPSREARVAAEHEARANEQARQLAALAPHLHDAGGRR